LTLPGSKEKILRYIEEHDGKKMKQDVVDFMSSEAVPEELRSSRVPTLKVLKELQSENRIKVSGIRQGQSHFLSINRDNDFDLITKKLIIYKQLIEKLPFTEIVKPRKDRPWTWTSDEEIVRFGLEKLLVRTSKIPIMHDADILYKKIINLSTMLTLKKARAMKEYLD
jgi:hypothetical protein